MSEASPGLGVRPLRGKEVQLDLSLAALPRTTLFSIKSLNLKAERPPLDDASITIPVLGGFRAGAGRAGHNFGTNEIYLLNPEREFDYRAPGSSEVLVAGVQGCNLQQKATALVGARAAAPAEIISVASPAGGALARFTHYFWTELQRPGGLWDCPAALAEMEDCLTSLIALASCAPDADAGPMTRLPTVRLAEDFLMRHLRKPVIRSELAEAAGVSIRTVSRAFREHHGVSPMAWLKARRLEAAEFELRVAVPGELTVLEVALRYGFENPGRFAAEYRRRFGETPSQTLRG